MFLYSFVPSSALCAAHITRINKKNREFLLSLEVTLPPLLRFQRHYGLFSLIVFLLSVWQVEALPKLASNWIVS